MARDVAQREQDQAGFRIINLGDPRAAGDATKTDNTSAPKANGGAGSPGRSFLAAPADHVHPGGGGGGVGSLQLDDLSEQSVSGGAEEVVAEFVVDFDRLKAPNLEVSFGAGVKATPEGHFQIRVGGTSGRPDGTAIADFGTTSPSFEQKGATGGGRTPAGLGLLKVTARAIGTNAVAHIRSKSVALTGVAEIA